MIHLIIMLSFTELTEMLFELETELEHLIQNATSEGQGKQQQTQLL